ncbi:MAG: serine/threonine-protein kinase, partial [Deltaproteobacteria bacterium]
MQPGTLIAGRFEIQRIAGEGGMGTVFRALDRDTGEPVAIKVIHGTLESEKERFASEARVLAELRHPAIVRYVSHGSTESGAPFLAIEWLEGEDLAQTLARGPISMRDVLALGERIADALALVHRRDVVHRDIKPDNIVVPGGRVSDARLVDFGIARDHSLARRGTRTGVVIGTPGYMSPEQARGDSKVDARADVFAFGCVLFECLTGQPPFSGEHAIALILKIVLEDAPEVCSLRPDVPAELNALVADMMAKAPAQRPANGTEVLERLRHLDLRGERARPVDAQPALAAISGGEQRWLTVVVAGTLAWDGEGADAPTNPIAATVMQVPTSGEFASLQSAVSLAAGRGAEVLRIAGGAISVVLRGGGVATDQAARAARCALAIGAARPGLPIGIATARGQISGHLPVGEVVELAAREVERIVSDIHQAGTT